MYKVLIIDDEKIIRIALKSMIDWEKQGFTVCGTASGCKMALEIIQTQKPHLLIVDIMMPEMDGITFIKQIRASGFMGEIILLSNYQSFDYAIDALHNQVLDYILKTDISPESLINILGKAKSVLEKNDFTAPNPFSSTTQNDYTLFKNCLLTPDTESEETFTTPYLFLEILIRSRLLRFNNDSAIPKGTLNNLLQEIADIPDSFILPLSEDASLLLVPQKEHIRFLSSLDTLTNKITSLIQLYMNTDCSFLCSGTFTNSAEFSNKLLKLPRLEQLVLYHGFGNVIQEAESETYSLDSILLSSFILNLKNLLASGEYATCKKLLKEKMDFFHTEHYSPSAIHKALSNIYSFLIFDNSHYLEQAHEQIQKIALQYRRCCTLDEYYFLLTELIDLISSNKLSIRRSSFREEIQAIDSYIEKNIDKKITLSSLAKYVNRSENYLSRIFKAETGINIINYINTRKMQKAKLLLTDSQLSINEISRCVGFEESSYFNKIFNKIYGMNPSDYRKTIISTLKKLDT